MQTITETMPAPALVARLVAHIIVRVRADGSEEYAGELLAHRGATADDIPREIVAAISRRRGPAPLSLYRAPSVAPVTGALTRKIYEAWRSDPAVTAREDDERQAAYQARLAHVPAALRKMLFTTGGGMASPPTNDRRGSAIAGIHGDIMGPTRGEWARFLSWAETAEVGAVWYSLDSYRDGVAAGESTTKIRRVA